MTRAAKRPGLLRRLMRPPRRLTFTREGRYFVVVAVGVGVGAINTGNNLLYLLLGWTLSFIIASGILSERNLRGLVVRRRPPARIFAGQPFLMEIAVENAKAKRASYSIEIEDLLGGRPLDKKCYFLKIPPGKTQRTSYRHTFARRGLYTLDGYRVATKFPFALFRKSRDLETPGEVLVYPPLVGVPRPSPQARRAGETTSARLGRRGEFFGLREWRQGDDRRDVHWKSTARSGRLLVREYEDELTRRAVVVVDNALPADTLAAVDADDVDAATTAHLDALERAISVGASLAAAYLEAGWGVQVVARGQHVPMGVGKPQLARVLRALALLPAVADDVPFERFDPRIDSVLVAPRGLTLGNRPPRVGQVMEA
ncbi:MAG: DUF58 domain-containing protein [Kofleriaceae bacterium]|nr:DUF58 domain-containing protein [Myxococcales bacterium]MCB9560905.1 DUF58 domain-containing protein [Kofleriaceae bacterium]